MLLPDRTPRVVIAEDDDDTRNILRELVSGLGVHVAEVSGGDDLVTLLAEGSPVDLLITDVRMPWMTGLQVALSARNAGLEMPIIFVTAFPDDTLRAQIKHLGAAVLLPKPFRAEEILSLIRERLPQSTSTSDHPA